MRLRAKLSSVTKNRVMSLRRVGAHDRLDVVGRAVARLAALHVDDGAEAALERTAAAGVEARIMPGDPRHDLARQDRIDRRRHLRQVVEIIVDRLGIARRDVAQHVGHAAFGLAGEQMNAEIARFLQIGRQRRQHGDAAADVKAAHDHWQPERRGIAVRGRARADIGSTERRSSRPCRRRQRGCAWPRAATSTIVLHSSQASISMFDVGTENAVPRALFGQSIDASQAVRRQRRAQPLNDVAVMVVMRRLDQRDSECSLRQDITQNVVLLRLRICRPAGSAAIRWRLPAFRAPQPVHRECSGFYRQTFRQVDRPRPRRNGVATPRRDS